MALMTATDRPKIVFFDLETTVDDPDRVILEFGAVLLCPNTLVELDRYSSLVRPANPTHLHHLSDRRNGITRDAVASAPTFADIADKIYELLNGRIWAGHNIRKFDAPIIERAFNEINMLAPEPRGIIDSLELLEPGFARRVGSMKLVNLARHFHLGEQTHRSLDDCLMNLEVLKFCATVLFMESSLQKYFDLENDITSEPPISVTLADPFHPRSPKILFLHRNQPLKLLCDHQKICYDIDSKFTDYRGRPRLNFVVYASSERLRSVLAICDSLAEKLSDGCGSMSKWRPVVRTTNENSPIVKLNLPLVEDSNIPRLATEIYKKDDRVEKPVVVLTSDAIELYRLLIRDNVVDAYISLETYDYKQKAGIRLVADKLIIYDRS